MRAAFASALAVTGRVPPATALAVLTAVHAMLRTMTTAPAVHAVTATASACLRTAGKVPPA